MHVTGKDDSDEGHPDDDEQQLLMGDHDVCSSCGGQSLEPALAGCATPDWSHPPASEPSDPAEDRATVERVEELAWSTQTICTCESMQGRLGAHREECPVMVLRAALAGDESHPSNTETATKTEKKVCSNCGGWGKISNINHRREETLYTCHVCKGTGSVAPA